MLSSTRLQALAATPSRTRCRITLWIVVVSVLIQSLLGCAVFAWQRYMLDQIYNARLVGLTRLVGHELRTSAVPIDGLVLEAVAKRVVGTSPTKLDITFYDGEGLPTLSTHHWPPKLRSLGFSGREAMAGADFRRFRMPATADGRESFDARGLFHIVRLDARQPQAVLITADDSEFSQFMSIATTGLLFAIAAGVAGTTVAAWFISGLALSPLANLSAMLRGLAPETIRDEAQIEVTSTELATFQRDLAETRERLREAFQAQDRLISNASHELKTPIAVLMIEADTLDVGELPPNAAAFVQSVREEMRRLGQTTENFVLLSRLRGGRTLSHTHVCPVNEFVMDAVAKVSALATRREVTVQPELIETPGRPLAVIGDVNLLRTMIAHVLSSAVRASPPNKGVAIAVDRLSDRCRISVSDEGEALPDDAVATLFDRYTEPGSACSGRRDLGLAIAQGVAELHGGRISVRGAPQGGCQFLIDLPAADDSAAAELAGAAAGAAAPNGSCSR